MYDHLIPQDHFLRRLKEIVDLSFVNRLVSGLYSKSMGRPSWPPVLMVKALLLQYLYNISDESLEEALSMNLAFKFYCDLDWNAKGPDATTLVKFRARLGPNRFARIFNEVVQQAADHNLISDALSIVDSTDVKARVDTFKARRTGKSPDPDSRDGYKSDKKPFHGYKAHTSLDHGSQLLTRIEVTAGNVHDAKAFPQVLDPHACMVTADKAYDTNANHRLLEQEEIESAIIPKANRKARSIKENARRPRIKKALASRKQIEKKYKELKNDHGLARCRYYGLDKTLIQAFLTATVVNLKRMVKLIFYPRKTRPTFYYIPKECRKLLHLTG
jgi:IS5 family transposase